jgi:hypothetical protein
MKRVLIVGNAGVGASNLVIQRLKELHGNDIQIFTTEEAIKEGLTENDFINTTYEYTMPKRIEEPYVFLAGGKVGKGGRARNRSKNSKNDKFHK